MFSENMRGPGIEPGSTGWKPVILPLNYPRIHQIAKSCLIKFTASTLWKYSAPGRIRTYDFHLRRVAL